MKKHFLLLFMAFLACITVSAQKKYSVYAIGFYNQENLFDTQHDEGKNDYDFLPTGSYKWDSLKYTNKLKNMSQALADMGTDILPGTGCAVIGLAEVENDHVMNDLVSQPSLSARGYKYVHIEGPDVRGIDCALLYNPSLFTVDSANLFPYIQHEAKDSAFFTRGFLTVTGRLADEPLTIIVCHLPSRFNTSFYREQGASEIKAIKDSILASNDSMKVIVMGDMNDDPTDKSMRVALSAKGKISDVKEGDMYNPWYNILAKEGKGTLMYRGSWNLFDQILLSPNLLSQGEEDAYKTLKFWRNRIQRMPYLFQTEGQYKGSPKRTSASGVWLNGYSDHLPVCVYLVKEKE